MIQFHFFGMPIKTLGSLGKIRISGNRKHTYFFFVYEDVHVMKQIIHLTIDDALLLIATG